MNFMNTVTILIADDHPLFRSGVKRELENHSNFKIIAEAGDGIKALDMIINMKPDIAILDYQMPGLDGIQITRKLRERNFPTRIILLTMHNDEKIFLRALDEGVNAYVLKDDAVQDIADAVNSVAANHTFISTGLTGILVNKVKNHSGEDRVKKLIDELTVTEKKILSLVAELHSNTEIADKLFLSKRTIENHKVNISRKLNLTSSKDLLKFAIQNKEKLQ